ncbi:hypothetical protein M378DRAFT_165764 [Amanita muscaria Koide BX008]|uniref:Uncharacterized protein n=1 Tax=Amanita muscaria (strain Koide BX008) TaxID=946122 RepID=A0A0C2SH07_AMAMK|nr:hypothetical protein M378DRAFT_165764 [Amanita muscaria Koide BX008]
MRPMYSFTAYTCGGWFGMERTGVNTTDLLAELEKRQLIPVRGSLSVIKTLAIPPVDGAFQVARIT